MALVVLDHVHHELVRDWFSPRKQFATCPITQGTLLRLLMRYGASGYEAGAILGHLTNQKRHEFWGDDIGYDAVEVAKLHGHRQVTDAYLAELTRRHGGRLATLDEGLAELHRDVAVLLTRS